MRVAFTLIGGAGWTGGANYLENLLSALNDSPHCQVSAVLFVGKDADPELVERLAPYLVEPPVISYVWENRLAVRLLRAACAFILQRDYLAERVFRCSDVDLVFQHQAWYGGRFKIPTLAWIADFQHRRLPAMFSKKRYWWRDLGYRALSRCATRLLVSSEDAKSDCEAYYPRARGRISVLPFVVKAPSDPDRETRDLREVYGLPAKFFYLPNQLWRHKNHVGVIEALRLLMLDGKQVVVVASGGSNDARHPDYPGYLLSLVRQYELQDHFRYLGLIPYRDILPLMRMSIAVINPSFFEGWSTTVEEAKAVGAPLLLSNLPIHFEQTAGSAEFFDPYDPTDIARVMTVCWQKLSSGPRMDEEAKAARANRAQRAKFANAFVGVCEDALR
jgi:glycosyltransferase involved in cell wall biosynthesis